MSTQYVLHAEARAEQGKGASRRLRHQGKFPGIVYGAGKEPVAITLDHNEVLRNLLEEAFFTQIIDLKTDGKAEQVVLRDLQRHPSRPTILHMDLQRIVADQVLRVVVPIHFINEEECVGVKTGGGVISRAMNDVEVQCLPKDLPEFITVDIENVGVDEAIHLSEVTLPEGVSLIETVVEAGEEPVDLMVVSVHVPTVAVEVEDEVDAATEGGDSAGDESDSDAKE